MKSAKAYKSALYISETIDGGFWDGRAVDRQISGIRELSDYWIREFLRSELRTTGPAGSKRLAMALRTAIRSTTDLNIRQELIATTSILRGRHDRPISVRQVIGQLMLSQEAIEELEGAFTREDLLDEMFVFDRHEFDKHVSYRAVELDNGAVMIAEDQRFGEVFIRQEVGVDEERVRFITEGHIVDEVLRKTK